MQISQKGLMAGFSIFFVVIREVILQKMAPILAPVNFFSVLTLISHCGGRWAVIKKRHKDKEKHEKIAAWQKCSIRTHGGPKNARTCTKQRQNWHDTVVTKIPRFLSNLETSCGLFLSEQPCSVTVWASSAMVSLGKIKSKQSLMMRPWNKRLCTCVRRAKIQFFFYKKGWSQL